MNLLIIYEHQLLADGLKVILEPNPSILSVSLLSLEQVSAQSILSIAPDVLLIDCQQYHFQLVDILDYLSVQNTKPATFLIGGKQWLTNPSSVTKVFQMNNGLQDLLSELNDLSVNFFRKELMKFIKHHFLVNMEFPCVKLK
jgi:DNA-binding NarL/FixJ family response regulator